MAEGEARMSDIERTAPRMPLSDQIRIAGEMAHPSIRGLAEMMLNEWKPEAERLEQQLAGAIEALEEIAAFAVTADEDNYLDAPRELRKMATRALARVMGQ
jgi:hypothetical protein